MQNIFGSVPAEQPTCCRNLLSCATFTAYHARLSTKYRTIRPISCWNQMILIVTDATALLRCFLRFRRFSLQVIDFCAHLAQFITKFTNLPQKFLDNFSVIVDLERLFVDFARELMLKLGDVADELAKFFASWMHSFVSFEWVANISIN